MCAIDPITSITCVGLVVQCVENERVLFRCQSRYILTRRYVRPGDTLVSFVDVCKVYPMLATAPRCSVFKLGEKRGKQIVVFTQRFSQAGVRPAYLCG